MLDTLSDNQKKALARVGLGIMGISYGGRIRTNEPDIYALFVDFFYVDSQEEILLGWIKAKQPKSRNS